MMSPAGSKPGTELDDWSAMLASDLLPFKPRSQHFRVVNVNAVADDKSAVCTNDPEKRPCD
jgi:hypothetical protein